MTSSDGLREQQERELAVSELAFELAAAAEEAGRSFVHLFRRHGLPFEPQTFVVTYVVALCSQTGLDGAATLELLLASGRLEAIATALTSA